MPLVRFPGAAVSIIGLIHKAEPARVADQCPLAVRVVHDSIQRAALYFAAFTDLNAGSDRFWHYGIGTSKLLAAAVSNVSRLFITQFAARYCCPDSPKFSFRKLTKKQRYAFRRNKSRLMGIDCSFARHYRCSIINYSSYMR